jgi:hypothetical protein
MEELQITPGHKLFVPQGAKINRVGAHITVEEDQEYFSRRFYEITQQIQALTEQIKMLQAQVDELKGKSSDQTIMKSN